ncbi:DUF4159 domain-containing protein [Oharaeibacter diazotrophicus]|uniref:Putative membrane protein (TIGR02226 family) n=3 Tax=Oharaeibacter diazotrophicus TaxID=1920512 RepID=A0A4R6RCW7_9HYPH|nr:DUF4159 domain-containing protein [Oharaeibacter diazotrophicus]TDP83557.1 putative membrane protein (TIGR02226 family) [Oharaeibacter diazotrophicus]BBE72390.1 hypothetical protein OHA_1_01980 [Pleomorphomonas sp. SM30]GLS79161.1 LytTR family transcriptional regulator [Oharaeibacter diazotrophicus]
MTGLPLAFATPWVLVGLAALPVLWWLLRVTPPRPETVTFPPLRLLAEVRVEEETPARTPWWLTAIRLLAAAAVIFALAGPVFRPAADRLTGTGPVWLIVDNGFSAAPDWAARLRTAETVIDGAREAGRTVVLVATADGTDADVVARTADDAARRLAAVGPRAWSPDHGAIVAALQRTAEAARPGDVIWIAEPADDGSAKAFAASLSALAAGAEIVLAGADSTPPPAVVAVAHDGTGIAATVRRIDGATPATGTARAVDRRGRLLDERPYAFDGAATETSVRFELPLELRNEIARVELAGAESASAVQLLDDRWRRRTVGLISGVGGDRAQPLLSPTYYLTKALLPFADIREPRSPAVDAAVKGYLDERVAAIVMADVGTLSGDTAAAVRSFVERGGVLIRFAGPHLAAGEDDFVPVPLRRGGRTLGGSLSWEKPQALAGFSEAGPFAGSVVPSDVTVERQVLAEPSPDLDRFTWASLADGTPLVTARPVGGGWLVLFHVTADTTWSNLPLSGAFVEMLRRTVALGHAGGSATSAAAVQGTEVTLPPMTVLDGFGRFTTPRADVRGLPARAAATVLASRDTPPGLYGGEDAFRAVNLMRPDTPYVRLDASALAGAARAPLAAEAGTRLGPWLFVLGFLLLVVDALAVLVLVGGVRLFAGRRPATATVAVVALAAALAAGLPADGARAQGTLSPEDQKLLDAVSVTRLAYVETGDATVDEASRAGLWALTRYLSARTALEAGRPMALDPEKDELSVYPLIYWPVDPAVPAPSRAAMQRVEAFMKSGGTVLFDTRDQFDVVPGSDSSPAQVRLREMLAGVDVPPLEPVPADHVLTKAFYLMNDFPGRYVGSPLWVEATRPADEEAADEGGDVRPVRAGDGVSPILITGNDFAGAWAADDNGSFLYPVVPGEPRQREFALRAGVNIVMYTLTGNYKADQVHVPALLERLGQ